MYAVCLWCLKNLNGCVYQQWIHTQKEFYFLCYELEKWRRNCNPMGIAITEETFLFTLHFADDQVVTAQDKEDAEYLCRKLKKYQNWGLTLNMKKTKYLCVGGPTEDLQLDEGIKVQACEEYVYLGVKIYKSGRCKR
jgi:hypothetical protein